VVAPKPAPAVPSANGCGGVAEIAVGRKASPILVAAVAEIEQHGPADQRNPNIADRKAAAALAQQGLHPGAGVQAESGAARQHDRVDALDGAVRLEQVGLARAGRAAADIDRGDRGLLEDDGGRARHQARVVGVSDQHARDVGDEVAQRHVSSCRQGITADHFPAMATDPGLLSTWAIASSITFSSESLPRT
jgi:hypothetical protein